MQVAIEAPHPQGKRSDTGSRIEVGLPNGTVIRVRLAVSAVTPRRIVAVRW
jgi:hypothetical protein